MNSSPYWPYIKKVNPHYKVSDLPRYVSPYALIHEQQKALPMNMPYLF